MIIFNDDKTLLDENKTKEKRARNKENVQTQKNENNIGEERFAGAMCVFNDSMCIHSNSLCFL